MNFHDRYATDKAAIEEGTWAALGDGLKVKVRRMDSAHSKMLRRKLEEPFRALVRSGQEIPEADQEEITLRILAESAVLDWRGVTDSTGANIPFAAETAYRMFKDYPDFAMDVLRLVASRETFKKQNQETDLGN